MKPLRDMVAQRVHQVLGYLLQRGVHGWVEGMERVRLIQVGANDGVMADTVHAIVKQVKVSSLLVEPVPHVFAKLSRTYSQYPQVRCLRAAIVADEATTSIEFFFLKPRQGLRYDDVYSWWSSTRREHLEKFRQYVEQFDELLTSEVVDSVTVNQLFRMSGFDVVDMLQVDVEGLDVDVIDSIDFETWKPGLIRFEHMHSDKEQLFKLLDRLARLGYSTFSSGFDTVCVLSGGLSSFRWLTWIARLHPAWLAPPR